MSRETNVEMRAFLWCCWHLGGAQSDVARLHAEDIDWESRVVSFFRSKTGSAQIVHFGAGLGEVLSGLPQSGLLFPRLAVMDEKHRASLFQRACRRVNVTGISLHSERVRRQREDRSGQRTSGERRSGNECIRREGNMNSHPVETLAPIIRWLDWLLAEYGLYAD